MEVGSNATAIASTIANIRDQTANTMQTVTQRLDDMEETIQDTFVDLKVDVLTLTLALLERNITTRFTAVDTALAQMASSTHTAVESNGPLQQDKPKAQAAVPASTGADTALPGSASLASKDDAPPANHFQVTTTFCPGATFPAGNRVSHIRDDGHSQVSHMRDDGHPHEDFTCRPWRAQDRDDAGVQTTLQPGSALPETHSSHFRDRRIPHAQTHRQPWGDNEDGSTPYPNSHSLQPAYNRSTGCREMRTDMHRGHRWLFDDREDEYDEGGYTLMGGAIKSPSNVEHFCQACQLGMSRYDTAVLADKDYHGGVRGFDPLTIRIIKNCGYTAITSDDIILCYRDIIYLHQKTLDRWTNIRTQQSGPSVENFMEKAMPLFQKLKGITMADLVHFYDNFQKTGSIYLLLVMSFDAVNLKLGFEGLCPPGLGVDRYASIAAAIMQVIP